MTATVAAARAALAATLERAGKPGAGEEAKRLVAHALNLSPSALTFLRDRVLTDAEVTRLAEIERQRLVGRSVARIVGTKSFHDIALAVHDAVLEPRDDTGALVELALPHLRAACDARGRARVWDIGSGSGTVVLALLAAEPRAFGLATDVSAEAVAATLANARALDLADRLAVERRDMLEGADGSFDLIVSNPPYIPAAEVDGLAPEVLVDPRAALDGGADGLDFYRAFAAGVAARLTPGGHLAVEIGAGQGVEVRALMAAQGWRFAGAMDDLGGRERALTFARG